MPKLLDSFPSLKNQVKRYSEVRSHSIIEWEDKVDPVLYELSKLSGVMKTKVVLDDKKTAFCGNDDSLCSFLKAKGREHFFTEPQLFVYSYGGLTDLSILRRLNEFPDETPRAEIEAYWIAESVEAASILIINPEKA